MGEMRFDRRTMLGGLMGITGGALANSAFAASGGASDMVQPLQPLRNGFRPSRFGQIHYRFSQPEAGGGALPLLCLHASPGSSLYDADFLQIIGRDRLAIAPDTPGYGLSDRPQKPATIADYAGAVSDLVDELGLRQIDLLGNHTGAATALELALKRPDLVRRIILNSAMMYRPEDIVDMRSRISAVAAADLEAATARIPEQWRAYRQMRSDVSEERAWQMFWDMNRDPKHLDWGYKATFDYDFPAALARTRQPMLILNPKDVLHEITARARGKFNGEVRDLPWASGTFGVHAKEVADMVRAFLDDGSG